MDAASERVHGTAVALLLASGSRAALLRGPPGAGKSDLALRCIAWPGGPIVPERVVLVADDQVLVGGRDERLEVSCPPPIRGLIEVRGLGIVRVEAVERAELTLVVDLVPLDEMPRLPDPAQRTVIAGVGVPLLRLHAFEASAPLKLLIALREPHDCEAGARITPDGPAA